MKKRILLLVIILIIFSCSIASPYTTFRWNSTYEVTINLKNILPPFGTYDFLADERPPPNIVLMDPIRQFQQNVRYYLPSGRSCVNLRDAQVSNAGPLSTQSHSPFPSYSLLGYSAGKCSMGLPTKNTSVVTIAPYYPTWGKDPSLMTIQIEQYDEQYYLYVNQKKYRTKVILLASCSKSMIPQFFIKSIRTVGDVIEYTFSYNYAVFCGLYKESIDFQFDFSNILIAGGFVLLVACSSICLGICVVSGMIYISCCSFHLVMSASKKKFKKLLKEPSERVAEFELGAGQPNNLALSIPSPSAPLTPNPTDALAPQFLMQAPPMPQLPPFIPQQQNDFMVPPQYRPMMNQQLPYSHDSIPVYEPMREEESFGQQMQYPTVEYPN